MAPIGSLTDPPGRGGGRDNSQGLGLSLMTCVPGRLVRAETLHTAPGEALLKRRRTRVRFPPPPPRGVHGHVDAHEVIARAAVRTRNTSSGGGFRHAGAAS